jgi:two-component system sensor histidine kinase UhpB
MKLPIPSSLRMIEHPLFGRRPVAVSTLWRVFTVNALVFGTAVFVLIVSPATIHQHIRFTELVVLIVGLAATLAIDLVLLALVLSPLRKLATLMGDVDPMRPGQRASGGNWASSETIALSNALNTMLDRVETERRESARRALAAQEAERLRVARELHDEVGQTLTAVALQVERVAGDFPSQAASLGEIVATVHHSLDDVRRIVRELRPEALDDLGLTDALISLCLRMEQQGAMIVLRELGGNLPPLSSEVELVIYRVAQEALTNALRHSKATEVRVALGRGTENTVVLRVTDDGNGLLPATAGATGGLAGMRERAILIEADLEVGAAPGGGVEVCLTVASNQAST